MFFVVALEVVSCDNHMALPVMSSVSRVDLRMSGFDRALASRVKSSSTCDATLSVSLTSEAWDGRDTRTVGVGPWSVNSIKF